jgi:hypothetical protein
MSAPQPIAATPSARQIWADRQTKCRVVLERADTEFVHYRDPQRPLVRHHQKVDRFVNRFERSR